LYRIPNVEQLYLLPMDADSGKEVMKNGDEKW